MRRLCIACLLAETPCSVAHLLGSSARDILAASLRPLQRRGQQREKSAGSALKELCEF